MSWLSEESLLVAENWDTVENILKAKERLGRELSKLLVSLEPELSQQDWWEDGWHFVRYREGQVYVSREQWRPRKSFLIWIGVERFSPERVFGESSSPQLYVWVQKWRLDLAQILADVIEERDGDPLGEVDHNKTGYVVKQDLQSCMPEEVETFDKIVRGQIMDFFSHYAEVLTELDDVIQEHVAGSTPAG